MKSSQPDDYWSAEEVPLPVMHAVHAAEAIHEATYRMHRMRLARGAPERLDAPSLAAVGAAFEDLTRGLAQFAGQVAGALPDTVEQDPTTAQAVRDGLVAFRITVLDASVAARALSAAAASASASPTSASPIPGNPTRGVLNGEVPPQRRA